MLDGEARQVVVDARRCVPLRLIPFDSVEHLTQTVQSVGTLPWYGRVGAYALHLDFDLEASLLANAEDVGQRPGGVDGSSAALVDGKWGGELVGMVLGKPSEAVAASMLLVGARGQDQPLLQLDAVSPQQTHGH